MYEQLFRLQEEVFKVLANQKRLEIVQLLSHAELSVTDMVSMLGLPQANLSQHLSLLRQAHVVQTRRSGVVIYYRMADPRIADACELIRSFLQNRQRFDPEMQRLLTGQQNMYPVVKDLVCGMRISVTRSADASTYKGDIYHFCASGCKQTFDADPAKYIPKKETVHG